MRLTSLALPAALLVLAPLAPEAAAAPDGGAPFAGRDERVLPGDDFYRHANGGWMDATEIPPDLSGVGVFTQLFLEAEQQTRALLEEAAASGAPAGSEVRQVGDYYASYLDLAAIEDAGVSPLAPRLAAYQRLADKRALARVLGEELRRDVDPLNATELHTTRLLGLWVSPDLNEPSHHVPYLLQGGLGLPDRAYYLEDAPRMKALVVRYQAHVATMLSLAGLPGAAERAARVVALERKLARAHVSREESSDVLKANTVWRREDFARKAPGLDWAGFFDGAGLAAAPRFIVWQAPALAGLARLVGSEPLAAWRDWLAFHAIDRRAGVLPRAFREAAFDFHGRALSGTTQQRDRWRLAVGATGEALGDAVGQLYVQRHFSAESKARIQAMVRSIITAFQARVDALAWMAPATRTEAKRKLATLRVGVGYPDTWERYDGLQVVRGDAIGNEERAEAFATRRALARLTAPVDLDAWAMTPQTVNAINLPIQNALNFPAAILRPPFFDPAGTLAANFGSIGAVIGHEISHSFDDQGALFDAQGKLANWWTKEDLAHFEASGAQLAAQYDAYQPLPGLHVKGKQCLSENIADLAGLAATHDAWVASLQGRPAPAVQGLSGEQQLFLAFAQSWRGKAREEALRRQVITDAHAPVEYRADTVRNLDAWYIAFEVQPGQGLYLAPKDRVRVW
jgi:predicted metalloendopeptidase